eukprot:5498248-Prymnesium_polylepis.2
MGTLSVWGSRGAAACEFDTWTPALEARSDHPDSSSDILRTAPRHLESSLDGQRQLPDRRQQPESRPKAA